MEPHSRQRAGSRREIGRSVIFLAGVWCVTLICDNTPNWWLVTSNPAGTKRRQRRLLALPRPARGRPRHSPGMRWHRGSRVGCPWPSSAHPSWQLCLSRSSGQLQGGAWTVPEASPAAPVLRHGVLVTRAGQPRCPQAMLPPSLQQWPLFLLFLLVKECFRGKGSLGILQVSPAN